MAISLSDDCEIWADLTDITHIKGDHDQVVVDVGLADSGKLTLSMAITLERNSNDPNKYGENFLKFTETNVGPGVGFVEYFEWTSPENFAKKGDWIDLGVTYDGKYARFYNNGTILYEQHMCRASCPEDDPDCSCGNIIYPAAYHRCPQYCECPTEECKRLQCPCGSNDRGFAACHQGVDAKPGEKTFVGIGVYLENKPVRIDTHIGLIHHLRLLKKTRALDTSVRKDPKSPR